MIPLAKILTLMVVLFAWPFSAPSHAATPETKPASETRPAPETTPSHPQVGASPETAPKLPPKAETEAPPADQKSTLASPELLEPPSSPLEEPPSLLDTSISLDLRDIDVLDVLKYLAIKANLNIVGAKGITGTVSLLLNDVTIRDAIDIILSTSRLAYSIKGNVMRVMTEEEYKALFGKEFYDQRETKIVRLKYASAKNVGTMLENTKSGVGRVVYDDSTGTVVMTDTPQKIKEMEEVIRHEELPSIVRVAPTATEVFDLAYAKADKVSEKISPTLTKDIGKTFVDERTNRLIVSDLPYKIEQIREIVKALDTKTRAVFIEAKIVQVQLNNQFQAGIDWTKFAQGHFQQTFPLPAGAAGSFGQMTFGTLAPQTTTNADGSTSTTFTGAGIIMSFLETFGRANVLSTPQIAVVDGEEAKIMVGTKEAYTTSSVTQSQATSTTAQQVTFIDVGVSLKVTPTISSNGFITMKIKPEVSSVSHSIKTSAGDEIPIVETTNSETTVMVKDGATVLIGGLMSTQRSKTRTGIPILSRIPILGLAFRSTSDKSANTELSILLTPHLMTGEETLPGARKIPSVAEVTIPPVEGAVVNLPVVGPETEPVSLEKPKAKEKKQKKWRTR